MVLPARRVPPDKEDNLQERVSHERHPEGGIPPLGLPPFFGEDW